MGAALEVLFFHGRRWWDFLVFLFGHERNTKDDMNAFLWQDHDLQGANTFFFLFLFYPLFGFWFLFGLFFSLVVVGGFLTAQVAFSNWFLVGCF